MSSMSSVPATNVVVLVGRLARPASLRQLPSGDTVAEFEVTVAREGRRAETVPVVWERPPTAATDHGTGTEVVVVGRARRRFFRAAGQTASRTEVVAAQLVPARQVKRARAALEAARVQLGLAMGAARPGA